MYKFKTQPYDHQQKAYDISKDAIYFGLFMEMGTGKTKVTIDTIGYLEDKGEINAALILAPKGVYDNWVQKEIPAHLNDLERWEMVRWQPNITKSFEKELLSVISPEVRDPTKPCLFVVNTEGMSTRKLQQVADLFVKCNPNSLVCVDESTQIKNKDAQRTKAIIRLGRKAKYRRILTGSPVTKSPLDVYSQCDFLAPSALGFRSFFSFQSRYALLQRRIMGARSYNQIVGFQNLDELTASLDRFTYRVLKKDCLDLPPKIYMRRNVELTREQQNAYTQMKTLALAMLEDGEMVTTSSVLTQLMRLQQIVCGSITTDEGEVLPLANNRVAEVQSVLEEVDGKVIIWAHFRHDIQSLEAELAKTYGPRSVATYYGDTPQSERQKIVDAFQDPNSELRYFIGQPASGGYGITLTEANTVIYYSNSFDLEKRLQSEDRPHRIGQDASVTYIDLVTPNTIDEKILQSLRKKINIASQVLGEDIKQWLQ